MAKKISISKALAAYRVTDNGTIIACTGIRKQIAQKKVRYMEHVEYNRILDLIGIRQ